MTQRQQLIVLVVEHDRTRAEIVEAIQQAVMDLPGVSRIGEMVKDEHSGTVSRDQEGGVHPLLVGAP